MITLAAAGWILSAFVMAALWAWQRRTRNAAILDAGWTLLVAALAVFDAWVGDGAWTRRSAIGWMMGSWGARLGVYLLWDRVFGTSEHARYRTMRAAWGARANVEFFWLFQKQALAAVFFSMPALFAATNGAP